MRIKFEINIAKKIVTFFFKNGSLRKWVRDAIERFPELSNKNLSRKSAEHLTLCMVRTMQRICEINDIKDWKEFKPRFISYNSNGALPKQLQTQKI